VNAFYQAFRDELSPSWAEPSASDVVVFRSGLRLWRQELEPRAAVLLRQLLKGATLEAAVAALATRPDSRDLAARLPAWLGSFVNNGFFEAIKLD
jgi:hypothetical protein